MIRLMTIANAYNDKHNQIEENNENAGNHELKKIRRR